MENDHHWHVSNYSERHSDVLNRLNYLMISEPGEYLIFDSDMFLLKDMDIERYRGEDRSRMAIIVEIRQKFSYISPLITYLHP